MFSFVRPFWTLTPFSQAFVCSPPRTSQSEGSAVDTVLAPMLQVGKHHTITQLRPWEKALHLSFFGVTLSVNQSREGEGSVDAGAGPSLYSHSPKCYILVSSFNIISWHACLVFSPFLLASHVVRLGPQSQHTARRHEVRPFWLVAIENQCSTFSIPPPLLQCKGLVLQVA